MKIFKRFLLFVLIALTPVLTWSRGGGRSYSSGRSSGGHSHSGGGHSKSSGHAKSSGGKKSKGAVHSKSSKKPKVKKSSGTGSSKQDQYVHGYTKKDGTHVNGYHRSKPNKTKKDNYSTKGNVNPYTGKPGTKDADR